jgi:hypothetical protein
MKVRKRGRERWRNREIERKILFIVLGVGSAWFLQSVSIQSNNNNKTYDFPCGKWLDKANPVRELVPSDDPALQGNKFI